MKEANGLIGTLCEGKTINSSRSYLENGAVKTPAASATKEIGVNSGYFGYIAPTSDSADDYDYVLNIDGKAETMTAINEANVVVLPSVVNVYSIDGTLVRKNVKSVNAAKNLPAGVYVIGGQKVIIK